MTQVDRSALVLHTAEQMFDLVNDVERYPEFLPWCSGSTLIESTDTTMQATLRVAKAGLKYSFTTRNEMERPKVIRIALVEGPFSSLTGEWTFKALSDEACKVSLSMQFDFSGRLTNLAMSKVFNQMAVTMVDAFVSRADQIYG
ncbi:type II toxin-antitoxin system RatA family toxin [Amphritea opalescens]|jgi:ribosome-associated toxin RatA of RatAB toxin-antitoxin module|uniref:Type II toxin-antitoxin system RatA family toxin n=1 Tax=Amphritea opalescens TaxID=2490544 RepID=A0A430KU24_9GAMM|nr:MULTISPECIES: type II toxin-antitoxin system RatA family toxin [Amphritea]MBU2963836.1 type II toxin-antitoxin system RatA family toxin [Amphritea atlantica]MDO6419001.1 type II toxin-antitoxin system RatA family toxin [Amphritea sp. 2_MG-2023]MDX2423613.1 type II toxin-antitoxin system RatA family toxin [Amphritea sp.]RTE67021.1 type II toxin-antitoxin system RatA family toxin [Amphritea opalescens]